MIKKAKCLLLSLAVLAQSFLFVQSAAAGASSLNNSQEKFSKVQEYSANIQFCDIEETDTDEIGGDSGFLSPAVFEFQRNYYCAERSFSIVYRSKPVKATKLNIRHCTFLI